MRYRVVLCWICLSAIVHADPPHLQHQHEVANDDQLPRIEPLAPEEAVASFTVAEGYEVELVASEPLVADPVAMSFDASGRLFIVEMRGYSERPNDRLGRVVVLEDLDRDGRFDSSTVFAEELSWPTAIICYDGGVFVGAPPNIWYMCDRDGDLKADERRVVFTGFGKSNVQGLLNSFRWSLDHRIHGATSSSGGRVRMPDQVEAEALDLRGRDFSFDPRTMELRAESGGGQHGLCFDDWGRKFVCSNSDHLQMVMFEDRYAARNPYLPALKPRISIADDGGQAPVYRKSPIEPWRILRTRLRVAGEVPGPIEGGGKPGGYFTGSTGVTIYRGDAWQRADRGLAIVGDVGSNLVHRKRLTPKGVAFVGSRIDQESELIASSDIWFRPVQFANAPDGTLHVLDMYREVIEHPKSLPPRIKLHLDLTSGRNRGRIYRVVPNGFEFRANEDMAALPSSQLVPFLAHANAWHRETAARLLIERDAKIVFPRLEQLVRTSETPLGRLHALYVLDGLGGTTPEILSVALRDRDAMMRLHATKLSESFPRNAKVRASVSQLVDDSSLEVCYQLAFSLGEFPLPYRRPLLAQLLAGNADDPWIRFAALTSLGQGAGVVLSELVDSATFLQSKSSSVVVGELAELIGRQASQSEVVHLLNAVVTNDRLDDNLQKQIVSRFVRTSPDAAQALLSGQDEQISGLVEDMLSSARKRGRNKTLPVEVRATAIKTLSISSAEQDRQLLVALLDNKEPIELQQAALEALVGSSSFEVPQVLTTRWETFSPSLQIEAQELLLRSDDGAHSYLKAIVDGRISSSTMDTTRLSLLEDSGSPRVAKLARMVRRSLDETPRAEVVQAYRAALSHPGDADKGRKLFRQHCSACHQLEGAGHQLGPNLASFRNRGKEALLLNILDPSREVTPEYLNYVVVTNQGITYTGMVSSQTATTVTLKRADDKTDSLLRIDIGQMKNSGKSLMPDGLEKQINVSQMADLLEYLLHH